MKSYFQFGLFGHYSDGPLVFPGRKERGNFDLPPNETNYSIDRNKQKQNKKKLNGLSPRANYIDRATAACRRSDCQLLRIIGATWSA
jgi:hypothetical protein